jgi:hypothetical protein
MVKSEKGEDVKNPSSRDANLKQPQTRGPACTFGCRYRALREHVRYRNFTDERAKPAESAKPCQNVGCPQQKTEPPRNALPRLGNCGETSEENTLSLLFGGRSGCRDTGNGLSFYLQLPCSSLTFLILSLHSSASFSFLHLPCRERAVSTRRRPITH